MKTNGLHIAINSQGSQPPQWVHLVPAGIFAGRDGRGPWRLSDPEAFIEATSLHWAGVDLVLDYEHQSEMAEASGRPAPAAGWIKELEAREDGVWGRVEWTPKAAAMIVNKEYRYLSPVFVHEKNGELVRLESAALTGQPNLELKALNRKGTGMEEFLTQLAALLGLAETATQEEIFAAVQKLAEERESVNSESEEEDEKKAENSGGEGDEAPPETLPEAEAALLDAVSDLVNVAEEEAAAEPGAENRAKAKAANAAMHQMGLDLARVRKELARDRAGRAVGAMMRAGRLTPSQKGWAMNYAMNDPAGFADYAKNAPVIISGGRAANGVMRGGGALTQEERAVCKQLGLSESDFIKARGKK